MWKKRVLGYVARGNLKKIKYQFNECQDKEGSCLFHTKCSTVFQSRPPLSNEDCHCLRYLYLAVCLCFEILCWELTLKKNWHLESQRLLNYIRPRHSFTLISSAKRGNLLLGVELLLHMSLPWLTAWRGHSSFASQRQHNKGSSS